MPRSEYYKWQSNWQRSNERNKRKNKTQVTKKGKSVALGATLTMQQHGDETEACVLASAVAAASRPAIRSVVGAKVNG